MPYLNVLNELTGQRLHWTEMTQVAPVYLASFLESHGINAEFSSFFHTKGDELNELLSRRLKVIAVTDVNALPDAPHRQGSGEVSPGEES